MCLSLAELRGAPKFNAQRCARKKFGVGVRLYRLSLREREHVLERVPENADIQRIHACICSFSTSLCT